MTFEDSHFLRRTKNGYAHFCPGCERMHVIPDSWQFNGDFARPTFIPSVKIEYAGIDADTMRNGYRAPSRICHYFLRDGMLQFCADCSHQFSGKTVALSPLKDD